MEKVFFVKLFYFYPRENFNLDGFNISIVFTFLWFLSSDKRVLFKSPKIKCKIFIIRFVQFFLLDSSSISDFFSFSRGLRLSKSPWIKKDFFLFFFCSFIYFGLRRPEKMEGLRGSSSQKQSAVKIFNSTLCFSTHPNYFEGVSRKKRKAICLAIF